MTRVAVAQDELAARRRRRVVAGLGGVLLEHGAVVRPARDWPGTPPQWWAAADELAALLRRPVRAGVEVATATVWMMLTDWPRTTTELAAAAARLVRLRAPGAG